MTPAWLIEIGLAAIGGLAIERRLAVSFPRTVSTFATLAVLVSAPIFVGPSAPGPVPALLSAVGSLGFWALGRPAARAVGEPAAIVRGISAAILAIGPTAFLVARAPWREAYPDAFLSALFGGQGLLYGGPLLWAGFLGLAARRRDDPTLVRLCLWAVVPGVAGLAIDTEAADTALRAATWLPFLSPGLAACFASLQRLTARRPARVLTVAGLGLVGWNALFMEQYRLLLIPNDNTASFARITANSARLLARAVGTPMAWPASWIFQARTGLTPDKWDAVAGRRLFPNSAAAQATIEIGDDDSAFAPDAPILGSGFGAPRTCGRGWCRDLYDRGTILLPLQNPGTGDLTIRVSARGEGVLRITLDRPAASVAQDLTEEMNAEPLRAAARLVAPGIHILTLEVQGGGKATLDRITIERTLDASSATARRR